MCIHVRHRLMLIAGALLFLSALPLAAHSLWEKAVAIFEDNADLVARNTAIQMDVFDGRGNLKKRERSRLENYVGERGRVQSRYLEVTLNGADITAQKRAEQQSPLGEEGAPFADLGQSPFQEAQQKNVRYASTGSVDYVEGRRALAFSFRHRMAGGGSNSGTAWLDAESGAPLKTIMTMDEAPFYVRRLELVKRYTVNENRWYLASLEVDAMGQFLLFQRVYDIRTQFTNHFRSARVVKRF
jgi:hypothetical protein